MSKVPLLEESLCEQFVRHVSCVDWTLAKSVLSGSGGDVDRVPVLGSVDSSEVERVKTELGRLVR